MASQIMRRSILSSVVITTVFSLHAQGQDFTLAGGRTFGVATKHNYASFEINLPWKENFWQRNRWSLDLSHAFSLSRLHDLNTVYLLSWAPNATFRWHYRDNIHPYIQFGFGIALLSDDNFQSKNNDPRETGTTDMGTYGQFESSLTLGLTYGGLGIRARAYHYSNANLSSTNDGIDVAELGLSYRF
jgi:lipid A 3-O-deacylase